MGSVFVYPKREERKDAVFIIGEECVEHVCG